MAPNWIYSLLWKSLLYTQCSPHVQGAGSHLGFRLGLSSQPTETTGKWDCSFSFLVLASWRSEDLRSLEREGGGEGRKIDVVWFWPAFNCAGSAYRLLAERALPHKKCSTTNFTVIAYQQWDQPACQRRNEIFDCCVDKSSWEFEGFRRWSGRKLKGTMERADGVLVGHCNTA